MNGGDLHYHLSQHGVFNEAEMKFYAAEVSDNLVMCNITLSDKYRKEYEVEMHL